jgi:Phage replication protein CRI
MIDYLNITIDGDDFPTIGKEFTTKQPGGARTKSFTEVNVRVASGAPQFYAQVETRAKRMRFWGSPAQFLQGHNGMGSNDFQPLVKASVLLVFETLGITVPASVLAAVSTGEYDVHAVDVAEQYRMPHQLAGALCDNIRRYADSSIQAVPLEKGVGVRLLPHSRYFQVLLYDKHHYFMDDLAKHKNKLLGNMPMDFGRFGTSIEFERMMDEVLAQGIRIETRLKLMLNNSKNPFNRGVHWKPETARELHRKVLEDIPLADLPPLHVQEQLLATATEKHKVLIALWLTGRDMMQFFNSQSTYFHNRNQILNKYPDIDLSIPPMPECGIRWADVIATSSIIEVPEWAKESGFVYEPERWSGWRNPTQNHRAWLRPEPEIRLGKARKATNQASRISA